MPDSLHLRGFDYFINKKLAQSLFKIPTLHNHKQKIVFHNINPSYLKNQYTYYPRWRNYFEWICVSYCFK